MRMSLRIKGRDFDTTDYSLPLLMDRILGIICDNATGSPIVRAIRQAFPGINPEVAHAPVKSRVRKSRRVCHVLKL